MLCPMKFNLTYDSQMAHTECEKEKCAWWREHSCVILVLGDINFQLYRIAQKLEEFEAK